MEGLAMNSMELRTFCIGQDIEYKEIKLNDTAFYKYYEIYNPAKTSIIAFPDGCIDIQCGILDGKISTTLAGSYMKGGIASTSKYKKCFGMKLRPGIVPRLLDGKMEEIVANRMDITSYIDIKAISHIFEATSSIDDRIKFFKTNFSNEELVIEQHEISTYIIDTLNKAHGNVNIAKIIETLGYSHRYSDRVFKNNVGFSIKKYAGIFRLQEAIRILSEKTEDIYDSLGYYDQSHFIHDFKRFTSFTPNAFAKIMSTMHIV